jgi:hypothetical protein
MAKVIAVCNTVPDTISSMLKSCTEVVPTYLEVGTRLSKVPKKEIIYVLTHRDFISNLKIINSEAYGETTIFLFCPVVNAKTLTRILFLDVAKNSTSSNTIRSLYKDPSPDALKGYLDKEFKRQTIKEIDKEYKYCIVESMVKGSLLNPLMTLLYSIKAEENLRIKNLIFDYFSSKTKFSNFEEQLVHSYEWKTVTKQIRLKLLTLLDSEVGRKYVSTLRDFIASKSDKEHSFNLKGACKKAGIEEYEIKYIANNMMKKRQKNLTGVYLKDLHNKSKSKLN